MGNLKLKNLLKKLLENRKFDMTIIDEESSWDGHDYTIEDVPYEFKFHVIVKQVLGNGSNAIGDIDIIIDDITKDGDEYYYDFVERNYSESTWYIQELRERFYGEYLEDIPFDIYMTVYGHDEKGKDNTIQESDVSGHIKRRYTDIEDLVDDYLLSHNLSIVGNFDDFISELAWDVTYDMMDKSKPEGDFVTNRNQMIRFIKTHFYDRLREFYDKHYYWKK